MIMTRSAVFVVGALVVAHLSTGCTNESNVIKNYGTSFNPERVKRGIPLIPQDWAIFNYGSYFDCINERPNASAAYRLRKRVFMSSNGIIAREEDQFYSGQTFLEMREQIATKQSITITYNYQAKTNESRWTIVGNLSTEKYMMNLTLEEADNALEAWGLSRFK